MFLDQELFNIVKEWTDYSPEGIQTLNKVICGKCEKYYKSKIHPQIKTKELKILLDRTFNLFDSFVRMLIKEDGVIKIIGEMFEKYNFKKQLLADEEMAKIYNQL